MARDCVRHARGVIPPLVIGRQPDLFEGPTVTHERPIKPIPQTWGRDFLRYLRDTGPVADLSRSDRND